MFVAFRLEVRTTAIKAAVVPQYSQMMHRESLCVVIGSAQF